VKLANDGYAQAHELPNPNRLPAGTVWRNEAFAFTLEPLVIVYNSNLVPQNVVPVSRYRLLEILTRSPHLYFGRIGIYDPTVSAIGYLTFTQDAEQSPIFWELVQEFGAVGTKLYAQARDILRAVTSGELLLGYNVPGSYAMAWAETNPSVKVVLPAD
jgi:ABC-type Fe3+ transport system substrate-binding protein